MIEQNPRMRIQSARTSVERSRPLSSRLHRNQEKIEILQRVYYNIPGLPEKPTPGKNKSKISSLKTSTKNIKSKESNGQKQALVSQNIQLKKKVHLLEMQISQLNGKMISTKTKTSKLMKVLDIGFQNQTLWSAKGSYLVTGVKNQYEKLQIQYKQKCDQLQRTKQTLQYTQSNQMNTSYQHLQAQSKSLMVKYLQLQRMIEALNRQTFSGHASSQRNYQTDNIRIEELRDELDRTVDKLGQKKNIISQLKTALEVERRRAKFNEKLVIQKDNQVHFLKTQKKKLQRRNQSYAKEIQALHSKIVEIETQNDFRIASIIEEKQRKVDQQRQTYRKVINDKDSVIQKLQKEIAYLTTLMSYWKPLDGQRRQNQSPIKAINVIEVERKVDDDKNRETPTLNEGSVMLTRTSSQRQTQVLAKAQIKSETQTAVKPRQQRRADIKRSDSSRKVRQVRSSQVQEIGQLLRFRLIAKRISMDSAKSYFSRQVNDGKITNDDQQQSSLPWQRSYITMKQVYDILMSEPFNLSQTQAELLSRYLIEDVQNDFIYCAWDNENKREVVKSILKNTVKDYEVRGSLEEIEVETEAELKKYKGRISTRLQQQYKDGFISKRRLVEIGGLQLTQPVLEFIIGKLAAKAQSLDRLDYALVF